MAKVVAEAPRWNVTRRTHHSSSSQRVSPLCCLSIVTVVAAFALSFLSFKALPNNAIDSQPQFMVNSKTSLSKERTNNSVAKQRRTSQNSLRVDVPLPVDSNHVLGLLYPPGLIGGYRNQVIRFISLCWYARQLNYTHLFQPTLWWSTQVMIDPVHRKTEWFPVPMDWVFDIDHWNAQLLQQRTREEQPSPFPRHQLRLPLITNHLGQNINQDDSDCWKRGELPAGGEQQIENVGMSRSQSLSGISTSAWPVAHLLREYGYIGPLWNETVDKMMGQSPHRRDHLTDEVKQCRRPAFHGGGKFAGRLWNEAMARRQRRAKSVYVDSNNRHDLHDTFETFALSALQPHPRWIQVAEDCLAERFGEEQETHDSRSQGRRPYVALHARVEMEMLAHRCGKDMEQSLQTILDHVFQFLQTPTAIEARRHNSSSDQIEDWSGLVLAVDKDAINASEGKYPKYRRIGEANLAVFDRYIGDRGFPAKRLGAKDGSSHTLPIAACGRYALEDHLEHGQHTDSTNKKSDNRYVRNYGSLVESIINFYNAVHATIFIGVKGSSYSTDVWTTRYHLGRGAANFQYTKSGIQAVGRNGLPDPHTNCGSRHGKK